MARTGSLSAQKPQSQLGQPTQPRFHGKPWSGFYPCTDALSASTNCMHVSHQANASLLGATSDPTCQLVLRSIHSRHALRVRVPYAAPSRLWTTPNCTTCDGDARTGTCICQPLPSQLTSSAYESTTRLPCKVLYAAGATPLTSRRTHLTHHHWPNTQPGNQHAFRQKVYPGQADVLKKSPLLCSAAELTHTQTHRCTRTAI